MSRRRIMTAMVALAAIVAVEFLAPQSADAQLLRRRSRRNNCCVTECCPTNNCCASPCATTCAMPAVASSCVCQPATLVACPAPVQYAGANCGCRAVTSPCVSRVAANDCGCDSCGNCGCTSNRGRRIANIRRRPANCDCCTANCSTCTPNCGGCGEVAPVSYSSGGCIGCGQAMYGEGAVMSEGAVIQGCPGGDCGGGNVISEGTSVPFEAPIDGAADEIGGDDLEVEAPAAPEQKEA